MDEMQPALLTNFAILRPVWSKHPECWPSAANAARHVLNVDDDQAGIVGLSTLDSNGGTASF
jgi:hypothetical protein